MAHIGELAALFTAFCWTITSLAFESASKKVGSLSVNIIRLVMAFFFLGMLSYVRMGMFIPMDATIETWMWLMLSGLVGFVLGDLFLFQAYVEVGARISMLIMSLAPPLAALFGWIILGEKLTIYHALGMAITLLGIAMVIVSRTSKSGKIQMQYPLKGILFAFGGALGQGLGLVISSYGMSRGAEKYDPFLSTQIRVIAAIVGFSVMLTIAGHWRNLFKAVRHVPAMLRISTGAVFGPFLGVSFSLLAVQHTTTGVASTIMAIVPVLIIPPAVIILKQKVTLREIIGAILAVAGVVVLFAF